MFLTTKNINNEDREVLKAMSNQCHLTTFQHQMIENL